MKIKFPCLENTKIKTRLSREEMTEKSGYFPGKPGAQQGDDFLPVWTEES